VNLLLDTSALLIHYFKETGGDRVQEIISDEANEIIIASVSIAEFARRLSAMGYGVDEAKTTSLAYASLADKVIPVDTAAAVRAYELSSLSRKRIPLIDALIAACASLSDAVLVHRDAHFGVIPGDLLQRVDL
jgi:predicted nucleic acid-binding protein